MIVATKRKNSPDRYKLKGLFPQLQKNNNFNFSVFTSVSEEKINLNTENISNTMIIENLVIKRKIINLLIFKILTVNKIQVTIET